MTEVAQVAAIVANDMDDVFNEQEHDMSDAENKEDDVHEDDGAEDKSKKTSHTEDKTSSDVNDEANKTDETHMNGVGHKENDTASEMKDEGSEAVNGVAQDGEQMEKDAQPDTNEDQNISDLALKKEKLMRSRKPVARSYVPKLNKEKGDVTNKFEAMQKAREERSRQRNKEEQQKRKDQYVKEREWNRRKQQVKDR